MGKVLTNNCILGFFSFQLYFYISKYFLCSTFLLNQKNNFTFAFNHLQRKAHQSSWAELLWSHCELRKKCWTSWLAAHEPHGVSRFTYISTCCSEVQKPGQSPMVSPVVKSPLHSSPRCDLEKLPLPAGSAFRLPYPKKAHLCVCICTSGCMWGPKVNLGHSSSECCPPCFLRQVLPNLVLNNPTRLAGQWNPGILLSLPHQCWDYKRTSQPSAVFVLFCFASMWRLGVHYSLSCLPSLEKA